jgi:hypothetical protein
VGILFADRCKKWERKPDFSIKETEKKLKGESAETYLAAAKHGHSFQQTKIGFFFMKIRYDWEEAVKWYKITAEIGNPYAQFCLGEMYREGGCGIEKDHKESAKWYRMVAEKNTTDVEAVLEQYYEEHKILISKDIQDYIDNPSKLIRAAIEGLTYTNTEEGIELCKRYGYNAIIGDIYMQGRGNINVDKEEAFRWYRLAAQQGDHKCGKIVGMVGFKCPKCDHITPLNTLSCNNCGGVLEEKETRDSRPSSVNTYTGEVYYRSYSTGDKLYCAKCDKYFGTCNCTKCNAIASMHNYGLHR